MKKKSAKDAAFERERARWRKEINALQRKSNEKDVKIFKLEEAIQEAERAIREKDEWIERLLLYTELSKDQLRELLQAQERNKELTESLRSIVNASLFINKFNYWS